MVEDAVLDGGGASRVGVDKCVLSAMLLAMMMTNIIEELLQRNVVIFTEDIFVVMKQQSACLTCFVPI